MSAPAISVAIATVRRPDRLGICLESVLAGRHAPAEIVVVDQGGAPETAEVLRSFAAGPVPVRHVPDDRRGLSLSRNTALRVSRGEVVAVTDDDCRADPGWLEAVATSFVRHGGTVAVAGRVLADGTPDDGLATSLRTSGVAREFTTPTDPWLVGTGANFAIRKDVALEFGGYDERLGTGSPGRAAEDLDLIHRLLRAGRTIRYEPAMLLYHARQTLAHRRATRWGYGHGVGTLGGLTLRRGDPSGARVVGNFALMRARLLRDGLAEGDITRVRDEITMLSATVVGVGRGLRVGRLG